MTKEFDINSLINAVRKRLFIVISIVTTFFLIAFGYITFTKKLYTADATVFIDPQQAGIVSNLSSEETVSSNLTKASIDSQISIISSRKIIANVIKKVMNDSVTSNFFPKKELDERELNGLISKIKNKLTIVNVDETYIVSIKYTDINPILAAKIANLFAQEYISEQLDSNNNSAVVAHLWLEKKVASLKGKVSKANTEIQKFRAEHNLFDVNNGASSVDSADLERLNSQLAEARSRTALAKARYQHSYNVIKNSDLDSALAQALDNSVINSIRSKYLDQKKRYYELKRKLGEDHLVVHELLSQIHEYEKLIFAEMQRISQIELSDYQVAQLQEETLESRLKDVLNSTQESSQFRTELNNLEKKAQTYQNILKDFIEKNEQLQQKEDFSLTTTRIISEAVPPADYSHPRVAVILIMSLIFGVTVSIIIVLYLETRDKSLKTPQDVMDFLGFTTLGYVPAIPKTVKRSKDDSKLLIHTSKNLISPKNFSPLTIEAFRKMKYRLDTVENINETKILGLISSSSNEGKTTIAVNFAQHLANLGHKTLLLDLDIYNPLVVNLKNIPKDAIAINATIQKNIYPNIENIMIDEETGLFFLPAFIGDRSYIKPFNAVDISNIFAFLNGNFDYIVVDLPPLSVTADTEMTSSYIDGFVPVIEWGRNNPDNLKNDLNNIGLNANKIFGVLFNKVDFKHHEYFDNISNNYKK